MKYYRYVYVMENLGKKFSMGTVLFEGDMKPIHDVDIERCEIPDFEYSVTELTWLQHRLDVQKECKRQYELFKAKYFLTDKDVESHSTGVSIIGIITQTVKFKQGYKLK